ncbi:thioesterase II family protein [Vallitalea guaymasensis]|uniref:thioesterase II family protein n=1 Tax=Vallitalea guaymasensis TaxID=1185412 RepID=UPI00272C6408|nr:thioesterase domain-containing protein [Vallitalea guaymasensis]
MERYKKWFPFKDMESLKDKKKHKVFCFHHAGGSASTYRPWMMYDTDIDILSIELPGKATRMTEDYISNYEDLIPEVAKAINEVSCGQDYTLYGHSMGAMIAFKTAYILQNKYNNKPSSLIVAGRHAPVDDIKDRYQTYMEDDELVKELKRNNGTPSEILENEEILKVIIPAIKNDYKLNESLAYKDEVVDIPIIAHAGKEDFDANKKLMERWGLVTTDMFVIKEFQGSHFFLHDLGKEYYDDILKNIEAINEI